ncbi:MoaD/ThiS family protein [Lentisphaerota bacterium ZTH]|nr:MoaD/ThiS family protein [Lentisphaerota bacterium]WET05170.1 MoaD/ThiS family protein [Lentisphaerota bacterium ZTH]
MEIIFNGKSLDIAPDTSLATFMGKNNLIFEHTLIELNGRILSKEEKLEVQLAAGDTLAAFTLVSGG